MLAGDRGEASKRQIEFTGYSQQRLRHSAERLIARVPITLR